MTPGQVAAMARCVYELLRDTGRSPTRSPALRADCLEKVGGEWLLVSDNDKGRRAGRRLEIAAETAESVHRWLAVREQVALPGDSEPFLFPPACERAVVHSRTTSRAKAVVTHGQGDARSSSTERRDGTDKPRRDGSWRQLSDCLPDLRSLCLAVADAPGCCPGQYDSDQALCRPGAGCAEPVGRHLVKPYHGHTGRLPLRSRPRLPGPVRPFFTVPMSLPSLALPVCADSASTL